MSPAPQDRPIVRREIPTEVRVLDDRQGIAEYTASDETVDSFGEVIRADGWRFTRFARNSPFVDSHRFDQIDCLLGKVLDFTVKGRRLVETVQWAIDVPSNERARIGWEMTRAGYLKAVSVGFQPIRMVSRFDQDPTGWRAQLRELGLKEADGVRAIYIEQEQVELSAVILGANPNALVNVAKAYRDGVLGDRDLSALAGGEVPVPFPEIFGRSRRGGAGGRGMDAVEAAINALKARSMRS